MVRSCHAVSDQVVFERVGGRGGPLGHPQLGVDVKDPANGLLNTWPITGGTGRHGRGVE